MKSTWFWLSLAAGAFGLWWVLLRRPGSAPGQLGAVQPGLGSTVDAAVAWATDLVSPTPPYLPPPLPPVQPPGAKNLAVQVGGVAGAAVVTTACVGAGGGPLCSLAAPAGKVIGQASTQGAIYVGGKAVDAGKAIGKGAVSVAKKLKFW